MMLEYTMRADWSTAELLLIGASVCIVAAYVLYVYIRLFHDSRGK